MKTLLERIEGKPSNALTAMVKGLRHQSQRPGVRINMADYVRYRQLETGGAEMSICEQLPQVENVLQQLQEAGY